MYTLYVEIQKASLPLNVSVMNEHLIYYNEYFWGIISRIKHELEYAYQSYFT